MVNQPMVAFIMGAVGFFGVALTVGLPLWKRNDPQDTLRDLVVRVRN